MRFEETTRVYAFTDWYVYGQTHDEIVYRPSVRTLLRRLVWTVFAAAAIAAVAYAAHWVASPPSIGSPYLSADWQAMSWVIIAFLVIAGVTPPLLALREEIAVGKDTRGNLVVRKRSAWTSTFSCPVSAFDRITVVAKPVVGPFAQGRSYGGRYRWCVRMEQDLESPASAAIPMVEFELDEQRDRPFEELPLPLRVASFLNALSEMTGLPAAKTAVIDSPSPTGRVVRRLVTTLPGTKTVVSRRTIPLDQVPPELRATVDELMAQARRGGTPSVSRQVTVTTNVTVQGPDGKVMTYNSLDELPPEVREMMRRLQPPDK